MRLFSSCLRKLFGWYFCFFSIFFLFCPCQSRGKVPISLSPFLWERLVPISFVYNINSALAFSWHLFSQPFFQNQLILFESPEFKNIPRIPPLFFSKKIVALIVQIWNFAALRVSIENRWNLDFEFLGLKISRQSDYRLGTLAFCWAYCAKYKTVHLCLIP